MSPLATSSRPPSPHALTESYEGPCRDDGPHVVLHRKCTGQSLAPEIHRSDVAVLLAGLGGRKWRERAGTPQNIKRLLVEDGIARRFCHGAADNVTGPVQFKSHHHGA